MNLSLLDREHLEAILLDPPADGTDHTVSSDLTSVGALPPPTGERCIRIRHALAAAHELLVRIASQAIVGRPLLANPQLVKDFLKIMFAGAERETCVVVFIDAQMHVIAAEELFAGTLTQTAVYPREVVRSALQHNAAHVICAHSHPIGIAEPSKADEHLTQVLKTALALLDIRLLDHIVIAGPNAVSLAERGLL